MKRNYSTQSSSRASHLKITACVGFFRILRLRLRSHINFHLVEPRALSNFAKQVDVHTAQKSRKQVVDAVRSVLTQETALRETVQVEELGQGPEPSLFEFPSCKVRKVAFEVLQIAEKTLQAASKQTPLGYE